MKRGTLELAVENLAAGIPLPAMRKEACVLGFLYMETAPYTSMGAGSVLASIETYQCTIGNFPLNVTGVHLPCTEVIFLKAGL